MLPFNATAAACPAQSDAQRAEARPAEDAGTDGIDAAPRDGRIPPAEELEAQHARIGEIVVVAGDVFDSEAPGEGRRLYRLVNRLHRETREAVIRRLLLVETGQPYTQSLVDESERILRSESFLYDAQIRPVRYEDGTVDLVVKTRDVWTLSGGVSFGRRGGANQTKVGLEDSNLFGTGRSLALKRSSTVDRTSTIATFRDPDLLGRRADLLATYVSSSDGGARELSLSRPFFALDSRWSAGIHWLSRQRIDSLYAFGEVDDRFEHRLDFWELYGGISRGRRNSRVNRWTAGFTYQRDLFAPGTSYLGNRALPGDRILAYPWIQLASIQDRFVEEHDLDKIHRTEDVNLGRSFRVRLGWATPALGGDRQQVIVETDYESGFRFGRHHLLRLAAHGAGRFGGPGQENLNVGGAARYYLRNLGRHEFFAALHADYARNLDPDRQLLLGGDNGLRGYPLRYLEGDRRFALTVEQRFFTNWHLFKLIRFGAAVFADVGSAWFAGPDAPAQNRYGLYKDVGVGLRLGSTRSARGGLVHIDIALPLDTAGGSSSPQLFIATRETF